MDALAKRSTIEYVFFDFAGTLVEGVPNWEHPQVVACAECGVAVTPQQVKSAIWRVWGPIEGCAHVEESASEETYQRWIDRIERAILAGLNVPEPSLDRATRRVVELQLDPACYRIYPDVGPALDELRRRGLRLGVISNFAWRLPQLLAGLGMANRFERAFTSAQVGYRKPRVEIFHHAVREADVLPGNTLFVGDDPTCDRDGARAAGLPSLLIDRRRPAARRAGRIHRLTGILDYLAR